MARTFFLEKRFYESSTKSAPMKLFNLNLGHSPCSLTEMLSKAYTNKQLGEDLKPSCLPAIVPVSLFFIRMKLFIFLNFTLSSFTFLIYQLFLPACFSPFQLLWWLHWTSFFKRTSILLTAFLPLAAIQVSWDCLRPSLSN